MQNETAATPELKPERLQKIIAQAGLASRRQAEEWILEGNVTVNGKVVALGEKATLGVDAIKVNGKLIHGKAIDQSYLFFKPKNVICSLADPEGRPCLKDYLKHIRGKVFPVGRLDFGTEGLLLLTSEGALAEKIQKSPLIVRVYNVKVKGHPDAEMLKRIQRGGRITDSRGQETFVKPESAVVVEKLENKAVIQVVFRGPALGDLKEFFSTRGFLVDRIVRVAFGQLKALNMRPGEYRSLETSQLEALVAQPELGERNIEEEVRETSTVAETEKKIGIVRTSERSGERPLERSARPKFAVRPRSEPLPARDEDEANDLGADEASDSDAPPMPRSVKGKIQRGAPRPFGDDRGDRGFAKKPWTAPRFGGRPPRREDGDRPSFGGRPSYGDRPKFGGRPRREDGDRPSFGGRPSYGDRPKFGDRPSFGDRPKFSGRPRRDDGDRPSFGGRPSFGDRPKSGGGKFGGGGFKKFGPRRDDDRRDSSGFSRRPPKFGGGFGRGASSGPRTGGGMRVVRKRPES